MAGASLLTLLDDIASILDDVALMSKVAAKKTASVLGDDLALNAQQVTGFRAERELPVVWAVAKGSLRNKAILVPAALLISAFVPWLIMPLLMLGGLYLCFEGFEKLWHKLTHQSEHKSEADAAENLNKAGGLEAWEQRKIAGAIRTDFVLSAEIIVLTLGIVAESDFVTQLSTLAIIAVVMTAGVYGLVAAIVKLDDVGLYLSERQGQGGMWNIVRRVGLMLVSAAPKLMKLLTVVGTAAMFMVGGGIIAHGIHAIGEWIEQQAVAVSAVEGVGSVLHMLLPVLLNAVLGIIAGAIVLGLISVFGKLKQAVSQ
ncbi:DUF808 domain-containing protein [Shewanella sp. C32]|uniref:DUF808 domain-containing protein n=1 Tax=Shewanella electrica TaxID=515560 RepID=A0ABT2FF24_9GAMM|nr:DUF808 domain-containing protein [Shewanella electrica]MCH1925039.1 DUF808 domain-containing protein [Shewanella electrica]MCS4554863.1 DUF808 domain-containing protein [Shewanella electrica]